MSSDTPLDEKKEEGTSKEAPVPARTETPNTSGASADTRSAPQAPRPDRGRPPAGRSYGRSRDRDSRGGRDRRFRRPRRRVCAFCVDKVTHIDYKEYGRLRDFVSDRGKILKSRQTGTCMKHQRALARAIKRARHLALLPFVTE